jgi:phosphotransferase system enzyme I (PtsI)
LKLFGIGAAKGLAIGPVVVLHELPSVPQKSISLDDVPDEKARLTFAFDKARKELNDLMRGLSAEMQGILAAQLLFLEDPALLSAIDDRLAEGKCAEWALDESIEKFAQDLARLDNSYLRERSSDIRDLGRRVLAALLGVPAPGIHLKRPSILVTKDLPPSSTASLDPSLVLGIATELGGPTSHSAIMARAAGIPAIVGVRGLLASVQEGDVVVLDASSGEILVNPPETVLQRYESKVAQNLQDLAEQKDKRDLPAATTDGHRVELVANIGGPNDVPAALEWGAEGVGLFRTEFLFMQKYTLPSEEEQYRAYRTVIEQFAPRPVIFRTLDIGGDKALPYLEMPPEENPFLGNRALRMCLSRPNVFKTQLRAILRASSYGNARIMFPMVATLEEFRRAKGTLMEVADELGMSELPEIGIMVEIPSAAIMADAFAKEVDFFSIGSNDLIQYTVAADRGNEAVSYLYQNLEPAVLKLVAQVIEAAHAAGKWVGMCGEMAGDPDVIPILLGLGLDEFSMSAASLPTARDLIRTLAFEECRKLAQKALLCRSVAEVQQLLMSESAREVQ